MKNICNKLATLVAIEGILIASMTGLYFFIDNANKEVSKNRAKLVRTYDLNDDGLDVKESNALLTDLGYTGNPLADPLKKVTGYRTLWGINEKAKDGIYLAKSQGEYSLEIEESKINALLAQK